MNDFKTLPVHNSDATRSFGIFSTMKSQPIISLFLFASIFMLVYVSMHLSRPDYAGNAVASQAYIVDTKRGMDIEDMIATPDSEWKSTNSLNFGNSREAYWVKVTLSNNDSVTRRVLVFNDALIDDVQLWFVKDNETIVSKHSLGDTQAFDLRPIASENFVVEVPMVSAQLSIIVKASSTIAVNLNLRVWDTPSYLEYMSDISMFHGVVYGYIFALLCYSLMMFATSNNTEYGFYAGYLLAFAMHLAAVSGHGYQYIWSDSPYIQQTAGSLSINITMLFLLLFTQKVLELKHLNFTASHIIKWQIRLYVLLILLGVFYSSPTLTQVSIVSLGANSVITLIVCLISKGTGRARAKFFTYVWLILNASVLLSALERFDVLPINLDPMFINVTGFAVETLLIGTGLINMYRKNRQQALQDREIALRKEQEMLRNKDVLIEAQQQTQEKLEQQVQAQTSQLEHALNELSQASLELKHTRNVDGLTGLPNRYLFDEHIIVVSENCIKRAQPLSVAILDLDHFKRINDTYGHLCGDYILKCFADLLRTKLNASELFACRFGGEEFVVVGQNKSAKQMTQIMEDVRVSLYNSLFSFEGNQVKCSVSIGVVSQLLASTQDYKTMLAKADTLLYKAKQDGRNRTVS
jgi:diguanylate cyclase (GGDEF)-like protein